MLDHRLTELCGAVRDLFDARACVCALVLEHGDLEFVAGEREAAAEVAGLVEYVAQAGLPVEATDGRFAGRFLGVPVFAADGRVAGVLSVVDPSADAVRAEGALPALGVVAAEVARVVDGHPSRPRESLVR